MDIQHLCRRAAAEGAVLLKNEGQVLPLAKDSKLAVFGRAQTFYYKSGTGSGGLVHIDKEPCVLESLQADPDLTLDEELVKLYTDWVAEHPFDDGGGKWAGEPWFQQEMPLDDETVKAAAARNDVALIVLARTAGEDHDNADEEGSYRLTAAEEDLLRLVTAYFSRTVVALNVGNIIDTTFAERYPVSAVLYIWQGGMEGANAFADLLSGKAAPAGKLTDTVAYRLADYPSHATFGDREKAIYTEDIYMGYRYFETFRPDAVQYPFGFGMTYTTFAYAYTATVDEMKVTVSATVKNTGDRRGKEVVQVYVMAPCGKLGTPSRRLTAFAKTDLLDAGESQTLSVSFDLRDIASYDDSGVTGHLSCYVLEAGNYEVYVGTDVRSAQKVLTVTVDDLTVVEQLSPILPPSMPFDRLLASEKDGVRSMVYEPVAINAFSLEQRIAQNRPQELAYTGDKGITLGDVSLGTYSLEEFIAQLTDNDLAALACGEGMNSSKATPGTGGALGGQTERLSRFGIPVCCVTDGPSGIRLDSGEKATLIPNGTSLASTWDTSLVKELYTHIGAELKFYHVDALLGPGINLHRHPLCGRNFEYFSEDPYLSGIMAAAVTQGVANGGAYSTIKHFCANNQETNRYGCESVVSERALRELYLKPFEIAVKQGANVLVMTAYNPVNGYWTASSYDLTTTVLRDEWGFDNFVMTDWWAKCNLAQGEDGNGGMLQAMIRAQNDVYMVCADADIKAHSILQGLEQGYITRGELQRCVNNICRWILKTDTFRDYVARGCVPKYPVVRDDSAMSPLAVIENPVADTTYAVSVKQGAAAVELSVLCDTDVLAQTPITVQCGEVRVTVSVCGTQGEYISLKRFVDLESDGDVLVLTYPDVVKVASVTVKQ